MGTTRFEAYCRHKEEVASKATILGFHTLDSAPADGLLAVGNAWTRGLFDGDFLRSPAPGTGLPSVNLTFVQSLDGNTGANDPSTLGGGDTDKHLIYEGLSCVDADAVLAGATTAASDDLVYSVWHPALVSLRLERGHPRHPAQAVVTGSGDLRFDSALMFLEPELRVFVVAPSTTARRLRRRLRERPWITVVDGGEPLSLERSLRSLYSHGIALISAIGGRRTATALLREQLVDDLYLTTGAKRGGEPGTPFHEGPPLRMRRVLLKQGRGLDAGVRFEYFNGLRT